MKTRTLKKLTSLILSIMLVMGMCVTGISVSANDTTTIYFKTSSAWAKDDPRFAVYSWAGNEAGQFTTMVQVEGDIYEADIPAENQNVIFVRMNPATIENSWRNVWNQSVDCTIPDGKNLFILNEGEYGNANGVWDIYTPVVPTDPETEPATEAETEAETEPATEPETEVETEAETKPETEPATEAPTEAETVPTANTIYFKLNSLWAENGARFAVFTWTNSSDGQFISMVPVEDDIYKADIPVKNKNIIFIRINPNTTENHWGNVWNQTADKVIPDGKICLSLMLESYKVHMAYGIHTIHIQILQNHQPKPKQSLQLILSF